MEPSSWILGVCGGSCSGKTTLARALQKKLGLEVAGLLYQDSYYIDQSARFKEDGGDVNFDHPSSIDFELLTRHLVALKQGQSVRIPIYDFVTHKRRPEVETFHPLPIVIVDGTLLLSQEGLRKELSDSIFIKCPESLRFERRKARDVQERGRSLEGVVRQFQRHVKPMHDTFVESSSHLAHRILEEPQDFNLFVDQLAKEYLQRVPR